MIPNRTWEWKCLADYQDGPSREFVVLAGHPVKAWRVAVSEAHKVKLPGDPLVSLHVERKPGMV